jgi:ribosomal protein S19E (S16A)
LETRQIKRTIFPDSDLDCVKPAVSYPSRPADEAFHYYRLRARLQDVSLRKKIGMKKGKKSGLISTFGFLVT